MTNPTPADAVREALPERVLALLAKHGGWQSTLDHIADLEARLAALAGAAPDVPFCGLERIEGMEFYLHDDPNDVEREPVKLVMAMSHNNTVYCHRITDGNNGICVDETIPHAPAKAREEQDMAVLDKYAEVAQALGFEGDAWFGDPLASHAEIVARANALADEEWKAKLQSDMEEYAQALAEQRDAEWQPMETAPKDGLILLAVEHGSEHRTFVAEASHEESGMVWCITTGWVGWINLPQPWGPVGWRHLPERAALATFAEGE